MQRNELELVKNIIGAIYVEVRLTMKKTLTSFSTTMIYRVNFSRLYISWLKSISLSSNPIL